MSLTTCFAALKKAGITINAEDEAAVRARSRALRGEGKGVSEAALQAVDEQIAAVRALLPVKETAPEVEQAHAQAGPVKAVAPVEKPADAPREDDAGNVALFAQAEPITNPSTVSTAKAEIASLFGDSANSVITVAQTFDDLPPKIAKIMRDNRARGMTLGGKHIYIVADQVEQGTIRGLVMHELGVHYSMSDSDVKSLTEQVMKWSAGSGTLADQAKWAIKAAAGSTSTNREQETLAYMIQVLTDSGVEPAKSPLSVQNFMYRIKTWIRNALKAFGLKTTITPQDMVDFAYGAAKMALARGPAAQRQGADFQSVWHGSPHRFDKFDTSAIGTGEGAQAYGYGLYFASKREIADFYRKKLTAGALDAPFEKDGRIINGLNGRADLAEEYYKPGRIVRGYGGADKVLEFRRGGPYGWNVTVVGVKANGDEMPSERPRWHATFPDAPSLKAVLEADGWKAKPPGQLYEVEIPEDSEMLLWDKPLSEQPEKVRTALKGLTIPQKARDALENWARVGASFMKNNEITGRGLYQLLTEGGYGYMRDVVPTSDQAGASKLLQSLGIKGIKYLDGSSRNAGDGSYNYVVFSGDDAAILSTQFSQRHQAPLPGFDAAQPPRNKPPVQSTIDTGPPQREPSGWVMPKGTKFDDFVYKYQDKNVDLKRTVEAIRKQGAEIEDRWDAYLQEELFHERAAKRTQDFNNHELAPLMKEMALRHISMDQLDKYLHARHAREANIVAGQRNPDDPVMRERGSGMSDAEADSYMESLDPAEKKRLEAIASKVDAIIAKTRDMYVSYGLESKSVVDGWAKMFKHYVPLQREDKDGGMGIGQGFSIRGKESKHRTGSAAKVVDILANIALQREKAIVRGEKNRVGVALAGLVAMNPNPEVWTFGPVPERRLNEATGLVEARINGRWKSADNVLVVKILGKDGAVHERGIVFNEDNERAKRMVTALKNLDAAHLEGLVAISAKITRYFSAINTQYNPVFGVVNLARDVGAAMLNLSSTPLAGHKADIAKHTLSALSGVYKDARAVRGDKAPPSKWAELWEEFQNEGGATGFRDLYRTSADRAKALEATLSPTAWMEAGWGKFFTAGGVLKVPLSVAQKGASPLFNWLSDYNQAMENAVRLSAYKVALEQGLSKQRAASLAKNLTVNFNRKGQAGSQAGALYAFFNAAMQGTARIGDALFEVSGGDLKTLRISRAGKAIIAGGVSLGVMQAVILAAAGFDDDDPPQFVRERSLIIPIGDKKYITWPMPLGWHVLPNIGRLATEYALNGLKEPSKKSIALMAVFFEAFNPIGSSGFSWQTVTPTAIDPIVALLENRDWTGKPIAKTGFDKTTPGHLLAKDTATAYAMVISEAINKLSGGTDYVAGALSPTPDQIDYLIGQVAGGVGREFGKLNQAAQSVITGAELPPYKTPLVGRFYGNAGAASSQLSRFYENLRRINEYEAEIKGRAKDGVPREEIDAYKAEHPESKLVGAANFIEREIWALRKRKRDLIKKDAPRAEVEKIEANMTKAMTEFNAAVDKLENDTQEAATAN